MELILLIHKSGNYDVSVSSFFSASLDIDDATVGQESKSILSQKSILKYKK